MKHFSLKLRSVLAALLALAVFIPVTVFVLDEAYTRSLTQAKFSELKLMNLALVSAFELEGDNPRMPEFLYEDQLNLPDSGYIGMIVYQQNIIWQSASALNTSVTIPTLMPAVGEEIFQPQSNLIKDTPPAYFMFSFTAEFESSDSFEPVHFYIFNSRQTFNEEREMFLATVWRGLLFLGIGLLLLWLAGIGVVLTPVRKLIDEIRRTSLGEQTTLSNNYPAEFSGLKKSINHLLQTEEQQRLRYKNSLGDLAHSLKTPLAVALGTRGLPDEAREALLQVDMLIQRQLKRATAGQSGWQCAVFVHPVFTQLVNAMHKVYRDKDLIIEQHVASDLTFYGDKTDLFELLGNLLDNACKAARQQIKLSAYTNEHYLVITVDDDGPGIAHTQRAHLLERGARLDTYTEGQGIGMAVVSDIVAIYQGRLEIFTSELGGAGIRVHLPYPSVS
ncbi:ATP-binding protein [Alteromonas lipotrueiana]|uniref:ATP-binding protein n=1 Tax=Alteromonas lipotrueiana TaxID=2803815 RepID=UPI001C45B67F